MKYHGFSLVEVFITFTIVIILLAVIMPSHEYFFNHSQDQVMTSQLFRAIQLTRTEALVRGANVTLCKSKDQLICGGTWQDGYIIHTNNILLFAFRNQKSKGKLHWRAYPNHTEDLEFLSSGASKENGTFWYCQNDKLRWAIAINQSGRARVIDVGQLDDMGTSFNC